MQNSEIAESRLFSVQSSPCLDSNLRNGEWSTPFLDASVALPWLRFWHAFPFMFSTDFIAPDCELNDLVLSPPSRRNWGRSDLGHPPQRRTTFHLCVCTRPGLHSCETSKLGIWDVQMVFLLKKKARSVSFYVSFIKRAGNSAEACFRGRWVRAFEQERPLGAGSVPGPHPSGHGGVCFGSQSHVRGSGTSATCPAGRSGNPAALGVEDGSSWLSNNCSGNQLV